VKKAIIIFVLALVLNILWENLHSFLYDNYMGGKITEFILIRAALFDALLITIILLPFVFLNILKNKSWLIIIIGIIIAIFNEWYGLSTGRWAYNSLMPILPIIKVGLTPTLQLGVLGYITHKLTVRIRLRNRIRM
jgi:voltage-gated potassium channel Kch